MWKIYTYNNCSYCNLAKILMMEKDIKFKEIELITTEQKQSFKAEGFRTVPQIYDADGNHVGGYEELRKKLL